MPYVATSGEIKTKPTQHSVKELRSIGIQPDILVCRAEKTLPDTERAKIALFTNVAVEDVISLADTDSIYEIPLLLKQQGLGHRLAQKFMLPASDPDLSDWSQVVHAYRHPIHRVCIAIVGKYVDLPDSYKSLNEALIHAGIHCQTQVDIRYIDAAELEANTTTLLNNVDAILVPGGFGHRGVKGKMFAAHYARLHRVPYLGICLGLQTAVIEFARHCAQLSDANSTEFDPDCEHPVIALVTEWLDEKGAVEKRSKQQDLGGTMRLGGQTCHLTEGTLAKSLYQQSNIVERHRHRYEVNSRLLPLLQKVGLVVSGWSADGKLVEMIELSDHPWFVACQFHPEFTSTPRKGHPLFIGFVQAALRQHDSMSNGKKKDNTHHMIT